MRRNRRAVRTFVAAVVLVLASLLTTDGVAAQVVPERERTTVSAERCETSSSDHSGATKDGRQPWHGVRAQTQVPAPAPKRGCVCGCGDRSETPSAVTRPVGAREAVPRKRSVELPLLHQVFRC
jgi:hypothetical protein